jgi:hypothetical protein
MGETYPWAWYTDADQLRTEAGFQRKVAESLTKATPAGPALLVPFRRKQS